MNIGKNTHIFAGLFLVSFLCLAFYAFFSRGEHEWKEYLTGQVAVSLRVEKNEFNTLAESLQKKQEELAKREKEVEKKDGNGFYALAGVTSVLGALLVLNFYFDWRRRK